MKVCEVCGMKIWFKSKGINVCFPDGSVEILHVKCGIRMKLLEKGFKVPKLKKKLNNWYEITKKNVKRGEIEYGK